MSEIRQHNFQKIVDRFESQRAIADLLDVTPGYVNQLYHRHRGMGETVARKFEGILGLPKYALDSDSENSIAAEKATYAPEIREGSAAIHRMFIELIGRAKKGSAEEVEAYWAQLLDVCRDLIKEGLYPDDEDGRMSLYKNAIDTATFHNAPSPKMIEAHLREEAAIKRKADNPEKTQ